MSQTTAQLVSEINGGPIAGNRNRIINGGMTIAQRATYAIATATTAIPTASTGYYTVDRWYAYGVVAGATMDQVVSASSGTIRTFLQFTGGASLTAIGLGQRIEAINSYDLASRTVTLSADLANTLLTTITWTAYYANTTDVFGTIGSPTKTQIATGTFTVNSTVTRYSANINIPAAATTGIEIVFTVGAQTSGTWTIGNVQLEPGTVATPFERRSYGQELALCQRYYQLGSACLISWSNGANPGLFTPISFLCEMRAAPTLSFSNITSSGVASQTTSNLTARGFYYLLNGNAGANDYSFRQDNFTASIEL